MSLPVLRFKEFANPWSEKSIDDIAGKVTSGATPSTLNKEFWNGDVRWMNSGELNLKKVFEVENRITELGLKKSSTKLLPKNCVLIGLAGQGKTRGTVAMNKIELCTNQSIAAIHPNPLKFDEEFVYHNLDFRYEELRSLSTGDGGRGGLNLGIIKALPIKLPSLPEQTKIANFLTAVDEKISQLTQKHDLLNQYKKGVMQQIFSQELRFKDEDGQDFPEWETVGFGEIFSFKTTNSYSRECLNYVSGTVKNIHYGDIHTKFKSRFNITDERVPFINENISLTKINPDCFCVEGDLVIADASEDYKDIGKCIEIVNLGSQPVIAGLHTFLARPSTGVFSRGFMSHAMQSEAIRLQIMTVAQGTKVLSISTGRLSKVSIPLPEREEQTKIANFLTAIDDKITAAQTQLQAVKQYKQGLLQQMFV